MQASQTLGRLHSHPRFARAIGLTSIRWQGEFRQLSLICFTSAFGFGSCSKASITAGWHEQLLLTKMQYMQYWPLRTLSHELAILPIMSVAISPFARQNSSQDPARHKGKDARAADCKY